MEARRLHGHHGRSDTHRVYGILASQPLLGLWRVSHTSLDVSIVFCSHRHSPKPNRCNYFDPGGDLVRVGENDEILEFSTDSATVLVHIIDLLHWHALPHQKRFSYVLSSLVTQP
jgi:hypothetical protein